MSNTALQSLVQKQSLETEKFNANLVPPIQTVVLVSNVQGYKEEEEGGRGRGGVSGGVQVGITGSSSSSTILTSNNDHGSSSFYGKFRSVLQLRKELIKIEKIICPF
jgi:hypothetical protein